MKRRSFLKKAGAGVAVGTVAATGNRAVAADRLVAHGHELAEEP